MQAKLDVAKLNKLEGWSELWSDNFAPWHQEKVNPKLAANLSTVVRACEKEDPSGIRFFVPLCGKTVDMMYLLEAGFEVVGCEGVEKAVVEFFEENKMAFEKTEEHAGFPVYQSADGRLKIVCGDFFQLTPEILGGKVDCVWDRGSFVAIDVSQRQKYAETMSGLLSDKFGYLLVSIEREHEVPNMMPHSVSFDDALTFFGEYCTVKVLQQTTSPPEGDCGFVKDNAFLLSRKQAAKDQPERINYWQARWAKDDCPWHHPKPNEILVTHMDALKGGKETVCIFIPLCGKSLDLFWLYSQGHTVVGLEGIPFVAEQIFQNASLEYRKTYLPEIEGFVFKTPDERLTVYSCDFFKMQPDIIGKVDAVFDRGAFEAINPADRKAYSDLVLKFLSPDFRYVLNGYEYPAEQYNGPPMNVPRAEVFELFQRDGYEGLSTEVTIAEELDYTEHGKTKFNLDKMTKFVYLIRNKI